MPFDCKVLVSQRLGLVTLRGRIDSPDVFAAMRALYHDPAWEPSFSALWDARRLRSLALEPDDTKAIKNLIGGFEERMGTGRAAFVAPRDTHHMVGVLLVRQAPPSNLEWQVFKRLEPALTWMGIATPVPGVPVREKDQDGKRARGTP